MPLINRSTSHFLCAPPVSLHANKPHLLSGTLDDLLGGVASGCRPTSVLKQLHYLKTLIQQKETDKLEKALEELKNTSPMSAGQWCIMSWNAMSDENGGVVAALCLLPLAGMPTPVRIGLFLQGSAPGSSLTCPCRLTHASVCPCLPYFLCMLTLISIVHLSTPALTCLHQPLPVFTCP